MSGPSGTPHTKCWKAWSRSPHGCDGRLPIVNLKNGYWMRSSGPEAEQAEWKYYWTSGRQGRADWPCVVAKLKRMGYDGPICLTAEYSDASAVDRLIAEDLTYAQGLLASV